MTKSGSDAPEDDSMSSAGDDGASIGDPVAMSPQEAEVQSLLSSLDTPKMPPAVHTRLIAALEAEPNPYAVAPVIPLQTNRRNKNRWLVGASGVAAAGVLGVILAPGLLSEDGTTPVTTAAVVPMTASGTVYEKQGLVTQISSALPSWKQAALESTAEDMVELPSSESGEVAPTEQHAGEVSDPSASVTAEPLLPGQPPTTVSKSVLAQINGCVQEMDKRTPIHVDIASYRGTPAQPAEPVAVFALDGDNEDVEIYVVSVKCTPSEPGMVREHVTVSP
ncbi:MAG: hypothetical protein HQ526_06390 [Actinobacteria bacterium]|nr:hypothetical protein [Actinomycetota bacterium]